MTKFLITSLLAIFFQLLRYVGIIITAYIASLIQSDLQFSTEVLLFTFILMYVKK